MNKKSRLKKQALAVIGLAAAIAMPLTGWSTENEALQQIKQDGKIRLGMYLNFEGLSFSQRGETIGLEVSLADLMCKELSKELGREIEPEIVNQEWAQIVQELRAGKYHAAFSAVIPSSLYSPLNINYTQAYLETGPVICCQEVDGNPAKEVTAEVSSLANKRVVVINDPAVRRVLRRAGVYVPADEGKTDAARFFPKAETEAEMAKAGATGELIPVTEILQLDEMPVIYKMIADGEVDAGVIDLGIIWWVANDSRRWSKKIHAFPEPVGPYIYSAVTRAEDADLNDILNTAISRMKKSSEYEAIIKKWHGSEIPNWGLTPADFLN